MKACSSYPLNETGLIGFASLIPKCSVSRSQLHWRAVGDFRCSASFADFLVKPPDSGHEFGDCASEPSIAILGRVLAEIDLVRHLGARSLIERKARLAALLSRLRAAGLDPQVRT
jgi:hypothetical protein